MAPRTCRILIDKMNQITVEGDMIVSTAPLSDAASMASPSSESGVAKPTGRIADMHSDVPCQERSTSESQKAIATSRGAGTFVDAVATEATHWEQHSGGAVSAPHPLVLPLAFILVPQAVLPRSLRQVIYFW